MQILNEIYMIYRSSSLEWEYSNPVNPVNLVQNKTAKDFER